MSGATSIVCPLCGRRSVNLEDIEKKYCGACHVFHAEVCELHGIPAKLKRDCDVCQRRGVWSGIPEHEPPRLRPDIFREIGEAASVGDLDRPRAAGEVVPFPVFDVRPLVWDRVLVDLDKGVKSASGLALVDDVREARDAALEAGAGLRFGDDDDDPLVMLHWTRVRGIEFAYAAHIANPADAELRSEYQGQVLMAQHTRVALLRRDDAEGRQALLWFEGRTLLERLRQEGTAAELVLDPAMFEACRAKLLLRGFAEEGDRLAWVDPETGGTIYVRSSSS